MVPVLTGRRSLTRSRRRVRFANQYRRAHPESPGRRPGGIWGTGPKPAYTFKAAYQDWDYALTGRYEAEIESLTPTDTITQKEASAMNMNRIQQFTRCFASFNPGGVPAPQQQVIKGTITGKRLTKEFYRDLNEAINDDYIRPQSRQAPCPD